MYDIVAMGELLIDFMESGRSGQGNPVFEANPGGAPCNVLAMAAKLGCRTAFLGKVGDDFFGHMLAETLRGAGIGDEGLMYDRKVPTTLALVHHKPDGDREFSFYRNPGADLMLRETEIPEALVENCRIFHFGSLSMTADPAKTATRYAVEMAKRAGSWISFDPNLREVLWSSMEDARKAIWYGIGQCDILKIADNELQWLTGEKEFDRGVKAIREKSAARIINVTMGKNGSLCYYGSHRIFAEPLLTPATIDTTGAGDTFCGCILASLLEMGMENLTKEQLTGMLRRANAAASIVTTKQGAIRVMPDRALLEKMRLL